jgi:hypothetical protein
MSGKWDFTPPPDRGVRNIPTNPGKPGALGQLAGRRSFGRIKSANRR